MLIDPLPDAGKREAIITSVGVCNSAGSDHAALAHAEATDDSKAEYGEGGLLWHNLEEVCGPWLTKIRVKDGADIDHGICSDELEEPAEEPAEARGHDNGPGRGDASVTTLFGQVKGRVIAGHGPDDGNKGHEDGDAGWEVGARVYGTPDF